MNKLLILLAMPWWLHVQPRPTSNKTEAYLKPLRRIALRVPEPSDLAIVGNKIYVASDRGYLYELDTTGRVQRRAPWHGLDFEALTFDGKQLQICDERTRSFRAVDTATLGVVAMHEMAYSGGANQGIEGLAFDPDTKTYYATVEKNPGFVVRMNADFQVSSWVPFSSLRDVSAASWHNGGLYLLGDEEHCLVRYDLNSRTVTQRWNLSITNPEGFAFDAKDRLWVVSDDCQTLYQFNTLP